MRPAEWSTTIFYAGAKVSIISETAKLFGEKIAVRDRKIFASRRGAQGCVHYYKKNSPPAILVQGSRFKVHRPGTRKGSTVPMNHEPLTENL